MTTLHALEVRNDLNGMGLWRAHGTSFSQWDHTYKGGIIERIYNLIKMGCMEDGMKDVI